MSKTMNIGIDHGYYAIKTRHFSFPAGIAEYSHEPYTLQNTLEFGGKFYVCRSRTRRTFHRTPACSAGCRVPEKGRTTPLYFEGLILGFRQPVYLTGVNFYTFDNGEKSRRTQKKRGLRPEKSGENSASLYKYLLKRG